MHTSQLLFQKLWAATMRKIMKSGHDKRINLFIVPLFNKLKALVALTQG